MRNCFQLSLATAVVWLTACGKPNYTPVAAPAPAPAVAPVLEQPIVEDEATAFAKYAGDAACKACHAVEFEKWQGSHHALAERGWRDDLDKEGFAPTQTFAHGSQSTSAALDAMQTASLKTPGFNGDDKAWKVERVIGHDPLRQFLVASERGRLHASEACWDPLKKEWFNVYGSEDRKPGEWGHWSGRGMSWNTMCAGCHNTRVRKNYDSPSDTFRTTMAQMTVGCEACHGPMKQHAQAYTSGVPEQIAQAKAVTFNSKDKNATLDTCGMCHARRTELTGDFKPGDKFFNHHHLSTVDHTDIFYPDGQIREEDYEYSSFLSSRMHHAGVSCNDCHDPHSGKRLQAGNALCMRCHTAGGFPNAPAIMPAQHTFHGAESTGSDCTNCHMPQTVYMQRHSRHDHGFTIPDPLMTQQFGIPNACNKCHTDKDSAWSLAAVEKWYGSRMERRTRTRTTLFAKAKRGDAEAEQGLIQFLDGDDTAYWKASACLLLERWLASDKARAALVKMLKHDSELVRGSAVRALEPVLEGDPFGLRAEVRALLQDNMRNVRVAAGWALRDEVDMSKPAGRELLHMLAFNADQPTGQMQLGHFELTRQNPQKALSHMQAAVAWDGGSPPFRHDLAVVHSILGDNQSSIQQLQEAIKLAPQEPEYQFKLALAYNEVGQMDKTIAALRETVKLAPQHEQAWYNLGLALSAQEHPAEAVQALTQCEHAGGRGGAAAFAAATIYLRMGEKTKAQEAVTRALDARPNWEEAMKLKAQLQQQ